MAAEKLTAILVKDKWSDHVERADDGTLGSAALQVLSKRVEDGFWYDGEDAERASSICDSSDGDAAWAFLAGRRDYEYEWVEEVEV